MYENYEKKMLLKRLESFGVSPEHFNEWVNKEENYKVFIPLTITRKDFWDSLPEGLFTPSIGFVRCFVDYVSNMDSSFNLVENDTSMFFYLMKNIKFSDFEKIHEELSEKLSMITSYENKLFPVYGPILYNGGLTISFVKEHIEKFNESNYTANWFLARNQEEIDEDLLSYFIDNGFDKSFVQMLNYNYDKYTIKDSEGNYKSLLKWKKPFSKQFVKKYAKLFVCSLVSNFGVFLVEDKGSFDVIFKELNKAEKSTVRYFLQKLMGYVCCDLHEYIDEYMEGGLALLYSNHTEAFIDSIRDISKHNSSKLLKRFQTMIALENL